MDRFCRSAFAAVCLLHALGCTEAATFELTMSWADGAPEGETLFVFVRVEEGGRILGRTPGARLERGVGLEVPDIPIGAERVVVIELREANDPTAPLRYYGVSEPFDLNAGEHVVVDVRVALVGPPTVTKVEVVPDRVEGYVRTSTARVELSAVGATRALLSNLPSFTESASAPLGLDATGAASTTWDLDRGLGTPCAQGRVCPRTLYVRFVDDEGVRSELVDVPVVVDRQRPDVVPGSVVFSIGSPTPLLPDVERAGDGASLSISFTANEELTEAPSVTAVGPGVIRWSELSASGPSYFGVVDIDDSIPEGTYAIRIALTDRAGHRGWVEPGVEFELDLRRPSAPDVTKIRLERSPWTSFAHGFDIWLVAEAGAVEPGSIVRVVHPTLGEVGRARAAADGAFPLLGLTSPDAPVVSVQSIDDAGNVSELVPIQDGLWVASLEGKVSGSATPNPHDVWIANGVRPALHQDSEAIGTLPSITQLDRLAVLDDDDPVNLVSTYRWTALDPVTPPPARTRTGLAFDGARGLVITSGGARTDYPARDDTFEWDGRTWRELRSSLRPAPGRAAMAWDAVRGETVLVDEGGSTYTTTGEGWVAAGFGGPTPYPTQMTYDTDRGLVLAADASGLWVWDGARWQMDPEIPPPPDGLGALAYDETRGCLVSFSGATVSMTVEHCGQGWVTGPPAPTSPVLGASSALVYDRSERRLITWIGDSTHVYTNGAWVELAQSVQIRNAGLTYDHHAGRVFSFGGDFNFSNFDFFGQLLENRWTPVSTVGGPPGIGVTAAYDPTRDVVVALASSGTGLWNGEVWTTCNATRPVGFSGRNAVTFSPSLNRVVYMAAGQVYGFVDGCSWASLGPAPTPSSIAYDAANDRIIAVGATQTHAWTPLTGSVVIASGHSSLSLAYDAASSRVVGYDGQAILQIVGGAWTVASTYGTPPTLTNPRLFARGSGELIAAGDEGMWRHTAAGWSRIRIRGGAPSWQQRSAVYDPVRGDLLMLPGGGSALGTYRLPLGQPEAAVVVLRVDPLSIGVPVTSLGTLEVTARGGAVGYVDGSTSPEAGLAIERWDTTTSTWIEVVAKDASTPDAVSTVTGFVSAADVSRSLFGRDPKIYLRVRPRRAETNGAGPARLVLDGIQVAVAYTAG
ncbi:MAG: hypothetical protein RMA76_09690 [Deltaproteobacteria bacterium]